MSVICLLTACTTRSYPPSLQRADSLASACPEQALAYLDSLSSDTASFPLAHRMYYRLLCIKAADKAYILHISDSLIRPVLHYYIEDGDPRLLPEAYYYAGRVYRDLGDDRQALAYFQKTVEAIRENGDTDIRLKTKAYSQRGTLYAYRDMYREALTMYQACLEMNRAVRDTAGMVFNLRDMGNMYRELHQPDSVLPCFLQAKHWADLLRDSDLVDMMQGQLAGAYLEVQAYDSAHAALKEALRNVEYPSRSARYFIAAHYYRAVGRQDSANFYYRQLLKVGTVYAQNEAYRELITQLIRQIAHPELTALYEGWQQTIDSLRTLEKKADELRWHSDNSFWENEQENLRLREQESRNQLYLCIGVAIIIILVLVSVLVGQYCHRLKREKEEQRRKYQQVLAEQQKKIELLESYQKEQVKLTEQVEQSKGQTGVSLEKKKRRLTLINNLLEQHRIEVEEEVEAQNTLFHSDLYADLQRRAHSARGVGFITSEEWEMLHSLLASAYPRFFERLEFLCAPNENEEHVSILIKLLFAPAEVARLTGLKPGSVSSIRVRLYQKATGEKGTAEMWDQIVLQL